MEFNVPVYPEDLEVEQSGNRFYVKRVEDLESADVDAGAILDGSCAHCQRHSRGPESTQLPRARAPCLPATHTAAQCSPFPPVLSSRARACADVGDVLAEAEVLCTAVLESRVFDRLYSLIKCVGIGARGGQQIA